MLVTIATLSSTVQNLLGFGWGIIWFAGMIVLIIRYSSASRAYFRCFDWIKENYITGVETPPWEMRSQMRGLLFHLQLGDAELEQYRQRALRRLILLPVWLFGWGAVFVAGNIILLVTGLAY